MSTSNYKWQTLEFQEVIKSYPRRRVLSLLITLAPFLAWVQFSACFAGKVLFSHSPSILQILTYRIIVEVLYTWPRWKTLFLYPADGSFSYDFDLIWQIWQTRYISDWWFHSRQSLERIRESEKRNRSSDSFYLGHPKLVRNGFLSFIQIKIH